MTLRSPSTFAGVTNSPTDNPPPWRPRGFPPEGAGDDPTLVDLPLPDPTMVHPPLAPPAPPPGYGPAPPYGPTPWPPPRARPRRGWLPGLVACGGLLAGVIVVAALLEPHLPTAERGATTLAVPTVPTTIVPTSEPVPPGGSLEQAVAPGTDVSPAKGWTVHVAKVDADATSEVGKAAWWMRPGRGKQYVLVTLDVSHQGERSSALFGEVKMNLVTPSGATIGPALVNPVKGRLDLAVQLPPKGKKSGNLLFEVPTADVRGAVLRLEPMFSLDSQQDQRYLALTG
jgi:hypothetical protein